MTGYVRRRAFFAHLTAFVAAGLVAACGGGGSGAGSGSAQKTLTIAVIPKGATHEHWKRVHVGAEKAAAEFTEAGTPVKVIWNSPLREDDREQQVQLVEGLSLIHI